jgi:hypothetical protein
MADHYDSDSDSDSDQEPRTAAQNAVRLIDNFEQNESEASSLVCEVVETYLKPCETNEDTYDMVTSMVKAAYEGCTIDPVGNPSSTIKLEVSARDTITYDTIGYGEKSVHMTTKFFLLMEILSRYVEGFQYNDVGPELFVMEWFLKSN